MKAVADRHACKFFSTNIGSAEERDLTRVNIRVRQVDKISDGESKNRITEDFQTLVGSRLGVRRMSQGCFQQTFLLEVVPQYGFYSCNGIFHVPAAFTLVTIRIHHVYTTTTTYHINAF